MILANARHPTEKRHLGADTEEAAGADCLV